MQIRSKSRGISLTEVLIGTLLLTLAWISAVSVIIVSKYSISCSRHKTQAMYVAQRILEEGRRWPFSDLSNGFRTSHTGPVSIDTNGTFANTNDDFMGNSVVTVSQLDAYRDKVTVEINWNERFDSANRTMREYFTTDITVEDVLK
jgi:Tfp pilus assembly protein PilV